MAGLQLAGNHRLHRHATLEATATTGVALPAATQMKQEMPRTFG
jgi:hypothetical protein